MQRNLGLSFLLLALYGMAPALAQTGAGDETQTAPATAGKTMSCDDMIVNAELKIQTVIEQDQKAAAVAHIHAAQDAIAKGDEAGCRAEVQQAMATIKAR